MVLYNRSSGHSVNVLRYHSSTTGWPFFCEDTMEEIWKDIPTQIGYQASDMGRVRSVDRVVMGKKGIKAHYKGRILKPGLSPKGYLQVLLGAKNNCRVHDLVLNAFVGPCPLNMEACHNDGIKTNNFPSNLRWDTKSANAIDRVKHGNQHTAKLSPTLVKEIRALKGKYGIQEIAKKYKVNNSNISKIHNNKAWTFVK